MAYERRLAKTLRVAQLTIGGDAPIVVQSMNSVPALDVEGNIQELHRLAGAGCELSRLAVPNESSLSAFAEIVAKSPLPLVADIHFDYRLALGAIDSGAAALRVNPGNIQDEDGLRQIAIKAKQRKIPIRVGVNSGSLDRKIIQEEGGVNAKAMVRSAQEALSLFEEMDFDDLCISLKASNPLLMIESNEMMAEVCNYPIHLGLTEAGTPKYGVIRSATALAPLLYAGIGDTLRISLTADPVEEIHYAYAILRALELREPGPVLVSCPGCGRTAVDIRPMADLVQTFLDTLQVPLTVAVMGCAVNGPGEAREADFGIAGGKEEYLLFAKGEILYKVKEEEAFASLVKEITTYIENSDRK